jgi:hypothetical protein
LALLLFHTVPRDRQEEAASASGTPDNALSLQVLEPFLHCFDRITAARLVATLLCLFAQLSRRHRFRSFTQ